MEETDGDAPAQQRLRDVDDLPSFEQTPSSNFCFRWLCCNQERRMRRVNTVQMRPCHARRRRPAVVVETTYPLSPLPIGRGVL